MNTEEGQDTGEKPFSLNRAVPKEQIPIKPFTR